MYRGRAEPPPANDFIAPPGNFSALIKNADDSFTRTLKNGTAIEYDSDGFMTARVDRNGNATAYGYDGAGLLTTITDPVGLVTTLAYSGGRLMSVTDPANRVTGFAHDGAGDLVSITDPDLSVRQFTYDANHRLASQTSKRNFVTTYDYGFHGRNLQANRPDATTRKVAPSQVVGLIDAGAGLGNLATWTDPKGQLVTNNYNALNRLTQVVTLDNTIGRSYDSVGNLTAVSDDDSSLAFTHDGLNRVLTALTGLGGMQPLVILTNSYDAVGNRISLTDDAGLAGAVASYAHDGAGRLTQLTTPAGQPIGFNYDPVGRVTGLTFPNTVSTVISYNLTTGRLSQLTHTAGATPLTDFGYGYNGVGNITQIAELTQIREFAYDGLQRLTTGGTVAAPESYTYDEEGNRTASHLSAGHVTDKV